MSDVGIKSKPQVLHVDDSRIRVSSAGTLSSKEPELRGMTKLNAEKSTELSFCEFSWLGVVNFVNEKPHRVWLWNKLIHSKAMSDIYVFSRERHDFWPSSVGCCFTQSTSKEATLLWTHCASYDTMP